MPNSACSAHRFHTPGPDGVRICWQQAHASFFTSAVFPLRKARYMIKNYTKNRNSCQVTFQLPPEVHADSVYLTGDFNGWDKHSLPMKRNDDGSFSLTLSLKPGYEYDYRFVIDGSRWENDSAADGSHPNPFGTSNSVVKV